MPTARWADALRIAHREVLREEIERAIGHWQRRALCDALMRGGVPAAPVHSVSEAFAQPHAGRT